MRNESSLEARNLHHAYGKRPEVLRGVDLALTKGSITALLGLNGAGKTTLLRSLLGLIRPQTGEIEVLGHSIGCKPLPPKILARIGYVPEHPFSDERMTAAQMLDLVRQVHPHWDPETVRRYLSIFNIPLTRKTKDLSAGTKAQLALTLAMAGRPDLLILDEPTQGLDPLHRHQYLQMLTAEASARDLTILITSHDLYQIERMADLVRILHGGCIAESAPLDELKARVKRIRVGIAEPGETAAKALLALPGVRKVQPDLGGYLISTTNAESTSEGLRNLPGLTGMQAVDLSLEEIFLVYCE